jgi:hypothetical protein
MHTLVHRFVLAVLLGLLFTIAHAASPIPIELLVPDTTNGEFSGSLSVFLYRHAEDRDPVALQYFQDDEWQLHAPFSDEEGSKLQRLSTAFTQYDSLDPGQTVYAELMLDGWVLADRLEVVVPGPLLSVEGVIESKTGGIQYPDGSLQDTAGITIESDPTVPAYILDGTQWGEISGRPAGLDDGDDDTTYSAGTGLSLEDTIFSLNDGFFWKLGGNATVTGSQFLGTTDNQALELRVNGGRAMRLEPAVNSPNILGGYALNVISGGAEGATISGGGRDLGINQVSGAYASISGGADNTASGYAATIGGGESHNASSSYATISGGSGNTASGDRAVISGGQTNQALGLYASVGGGQTNIASSSYTTISGGVVNTASESYSTIGGGAGNIASDLYSTIGGGRDGQAEAKYAVIAGGGPANEGNPMSSNNRVTDEYGTVGGGGANRAGDGAGTKSDAIFATVAGGRGNVAESTYAVVSGGNTNVANGYAATIAGGEAQITDNNFATVSGGTFNIANGQYATVSGGRENTASNQSAVVSGGFSNTASNVFSYVGGGTLNAASGISATVPGGQENTASGQYALAAGYRAGAQHNGTFVWSDSSADIFNSTANDQFLINAAGGVGIGTNSPSEILTVGGNILVQGGDHPRFRGAITGYEPEGQMNRPSAVYSVGTNVFVTSFAWNTFHVIDASDPENMVEISRTTANLYGPVSISILGHLAYIVSQLNDRLVILDMSGLGAPISVGSVTTSDHPNSLFVSGRYAYVVTNTMLEIYDISDPQNIVSKDSISTDLDRPSDIHVSSGVAYVASQYNNRFAMFDISDPDNIIFVQGTSEEVVSPISIHVLGGVAFVTMGESDSLVAYDVKDENAPVLLGSISTNLDAPSDVVVSGKYAYVASSGNDRLAVFDVSDPANMIATGFASSGLDRPVALYVTGGRIYVASDQNDSVVAFDINHLESPMVQTGNLQASQLEVTDHTRVNHLDVRGGLNVGSLGALINGDLSVWGSVAPAADDSHSLGEIGKRWTELHAVNGVIQTSDARLKHNVKPLSYGIGDVMKLRPVTFSWKNGDPRERHPGLIAQEVREIFPEVVRGDTNGNDILGLNYSELVPILVSAIKDLRTEVSDQSYIIEDLEKRLQALERTQGRPR